MSNSDLKKEKEKTEELKCPNAPKITIKPVQKRIPYINTIREGDSSDEEQYENPPPIKIKENIKEKDDKDDRYEDEDSFEDEKETKSESGNNRDFRKFRESNPESIS